MLRMWQETSPYHNIEYDIDEEIEMEVCLKQDWLYTTNIV